VCTATAVVSVVRGIVAISVSRVVSKASKRGGMCSALMQRSAYISSYCCVVSQRSYARACVSVTAVLHLSSSCECNLPCALLPAVHFL
jgi:hypothetical protein